MSRFSTLPIACLTLVGLLSACAPTWQKPGATEQDFEVAESACMNSAAKQFPPALGPTNQSPGYTTPMVTRCGQSPDMGGCIQHGSDYVAPAVAGADINQDARDGAIRSCLYEKGWTPKD